MWAVGVILFTLLVGKPPFEDVDAKSTYKRILDGAYEWPADCRVSNELKDLV